MYPVYLEAEKRFKSKTFIEWIEFGQMVDCCLTPVLEAGELHENPYFKEKQLLFASAWGDYQVKMHSDQDIEFDAPPPRKGEHTKQIIREI